MCDENCTKCENCIEHKLEIQINEGLFPHTRYILGVKCSRTNNVAYTAFDLQNKVYK